MKIWNRILSSIGKYQGTSGNQEQIQEKIDSGKKVTINNPTSLRTFTKGQQTRRQNGQFEKRSYTTGEVEIGDTTANHVKKDYAKTAERTSSAIQSAKYDPRTNTATIRFAGGNKDYQYEVTPEEFNDFVNAPSKGQHVASLWNHNPHFRKQGV